MDKDKMNYFLTTERIGFSHWRQEDIDLARLLWGDPEVTRYICASGSYSDAEVPVRLEREIETRHRSGVQYFPIYHLESGDLIGCCGLHPHEVREQVQKKRTEEAAEKEKTEDAVQKKRTEEAAEKINRRDKEETPEGPEVKQAEGQEEVFVKEKPAEQMPQTEATEKENGIKEYELGFHLRPAYWRQGYAVEAARAMIRYAFDELGAASLFAGHNPKNTASRQVLGKLGFTYIGDEYYAPTGLMHPSYRMKANKALCLGEL